MFNGNGFVRTVNSGLTDDARDVEGIFDTLFSVNEIYANYYLPGERFQNRCSWQTH